ncbi:MAG: hypothetical protein H6723_18065, partial [Sandaracinus sp.]|nr:hypothetical protein [Sandaracinus sp.]
ALGGWLALCVEVVAGAVLLWHRLLRGNWRDAAEASRRASLLEDEARISLVPA